VEEFSVGIGPKLLGFKAFGDEFNLRALPLGGYVRFPENYNATQVYELQEAAMKQQAQQQTEQENDGESSLLSGLMNVFTLGGYERKRREVENERLAQERDQTPWWRRTFASKEPQKKAVERPKSFEIEYYDDPDLLQNRPWFQRALVLSGGVVFNILLAFTIFFGEINIGSGLPQPVFEQGAVVTAIPRADAASKGILKPGDVIVSVNGELR
jgi:membrane-associated protease RseP (regulator of RpoE activity)